MYNIVEKCLYVFAYLINDLTFPEIQREFPYLVTFMVHLAEMMDGQHWSITIHQKTFLHKKKEDVHSTFDTVGRSVLTELHGGSLFSVINAFFRDDDWIEKEDNTKLIVRICEQLIKTNFLDTAHLEYLITYETDS